MKKFIFYSIFLHALLLVVLFDFQKKDTLSESSQTWKGSVSVLDIGIIAEKEMPSKKNDSPKKVKGNLNLTDSTIKKSGEISKNNSSIESSKGLDGQGSANPSILALVRKEIDKKKSYPLISLEQKKQGTTLLSFNISQSGRAENILILQSSGDNTLDQAALKALKSATQLPFISGTLKLPIEFKIKERD